MARGANMRDLLYKNLTSQDKRRKVIACSEISDKQGVRSVIRRHSIYMVKEVSGTSFQKPEPYLYVLKVRDTKAQTEKFLCRIKGSVFVVHDGKLFLIIFQHSLKITLAAISEEVDKI
jgi:hypothetical protein